MKQKHRDRIVDWALILLFVLVVAGCAYLVIRIMTRWSVKGLG